MSPACWICAARMLRPLFAGLSLMLVLLVMPAAAYARVTDIVVDDDQPAGDGYHQISGRAFGELDPNDPLNAIIQDIQLGVEADGKVHYVASFVLTLPNDLSKASGMLWHDVPNRGTPIQIGALERQQATCPKIIEHFGSSEVWALKLTPEWVGTSADTDIPLPDNVRRYYIPSTTHGGATIAAPNSIFNASLAGSLLPPPSCPGNNYGTGILPANPVPHSDTVAAILVHFRDWVMNDIAPPASRYPTLRDGNLVDPVKAAMGFPSIPASVAGPGWRTTVPEPGFINPMLDYDWGPDFNSVDATGVPTRLPPPIKHVIKMLVPRVNADGNEVGGVPVVLDDAPLGTYLGWNITDARMSPPLAQYRPFHGGQLCDYVGGMIPFARTKAEREAAGDPRLSLEERYTNHEGYVNAVRQAAANAVGEGFLLQTSADTIIAQAEDSDVLK